MSRAIRVLVPCSGMYYLTMVGLRGEADGWKKSGSWECASTACLPPTSNINDTPDTSGTGEQEWKKKNGASDGGAGGLELWR